MQTNLGAQGQGKIFSAPENNFLSSEILVGAAVPLVNQTDKNVTTLTLPIGQWLTWATVAYSPAATTNITDLIAAISLVTDTLPVSPAEGAFWRRNIPGGEVPNAELTYPIGLRKMSILTPTPIYLVAYGSFTVDTLAAFGFLGAIKLSD